MNQRFKLFTNVNALLVGLLGRQLELYRQNVFYLDWLIISYGGLPSGHFIYYPQSLGIESRMTSEHYSRILHVAILRDKKCHGDTSISTVCEGFGRIFHLVFDPRVHCFQSAGEFRRKLIWERVI